MRFNEWKRTATSKLPYCFEVNDGELFAFAGLWDRWKDPNGNWIRTCSILTTTPNAVTSAVHDRMPVILDPDSYNLWLDPGMQDVAAASDLLKPFDARLMRCYPISTRINHVANDDAECSTPVELAPTVQSSLFDVPASEFRLILDIHNWLLRFVVTVTKAKINGVGGSTD